MKLWFFLALMFISYNAQAQDITISDTESDSLSKSLKELYILEDSVKYYKQIEDFVREDAKRIKMDATIKKALLEYMIQDLIEKYRVPADYSFKLDENGKLFFTRKIDGDTSGS